LVVSVNDLLERLKDSIVTQKRFLADAAHQLKTPLAGLRMQADLAQRSGSSEEDLKKSLQQIGRASVQATHTVNQLLSLARAEPGRTEPMAHRVLDIDDIARAAAEHWVPQAIARSIDLGFEAGCRRTEGPVLVSGDALMLTEMLGNLIDNALRYTQPGGTVTVSVERAVEDGRPKVLLAVEDDGPGIDASERERVFERFHRVLGTGTEGAGLGLAIVREIARAHGGRVDLATGTGGVGTRFTVVLPRSAPAVALVGSAPAVPAPDPGRSDGLPSGGTASHPGSLPG
jgi:two-component system sensor histidine kinase TctE